MPEADAVESRRELITRLVPYLAFSAIKLGAFASPLSLVSNAAARYNEEAGRTRDKVNDLLPLLPGIERLKVEVLAPGEVSVTLQRHDVLTCADQYLVGVFKGEGADRARAGVPSPASVEGKMDHVIRLPSRSIYLKLFENLTDADVGSMRELAKRLNPAEVWVVADVGPRFDERMDPVFTSEGKVLRGRLKGISTADMLSGLFGGRFDVFTGRAQTEGVKVTLKLASNRG